MKNRLAYRLFAILLFAVLLNGCATKWQPSWREFAEVSPGQASPGLLDAARKKFESADNRERLQDAIAAYKKVLQADPNNIEALTKLSSQTILMGTAYTEGRSAKAKVFQRAMKYAEQAMYTNPDFKKQVDGGATPWEAVGSTNKREAEAIMLWVTALQYEFKETMGLIGKITNIRRLRNTLPMLKHIEKIAPDFGGGSIELALSIDYFVLPGSMGGDDALGEAYMKKTVEKHKDWLIGRWARGKYYQDLSGNKGGTREDLQWVASRDISKFKDPYPWRAHFKENALALLAED